MIHILNNSINFNWQYCIGYTRWSLTVFVLLLHFLIYLPEDDIIEVERRRRHMSDKWLLCILWVKVLYNEYSAQNMDCIQVGNTFFRCPIYFNFS